MKATRHRCLALLLAAGLTACMKHVDPVDRYVGTYDCQVNVTETNLPGNRSKASQGIFTVVISRPEGDSLVIVQDGFINLALTAELSPTNRLIIRKQEIEVGNTLTSYVGVMSATGSGSTDGNKISISYTATAGAGKYTFATQLTGTRR